MVAVKLGILKLRNSKLFSSPFLILHSDALNNNLSKNFPTSYHHISTFQRRRMNNLANTTISNLNEEVQNLANEDIEPHPQAFKILTLVIGSTLLIFHHVNHDYVRTAIRLDLQQFIEFRMRKSGI